MKAKLFNLIRKYHLNVSIYTAEIFERRCQEEIIRSDEDKSSFVYLELDFATVQKILVTDERIELFWRVFFTALNKNNRGSDIIGFLENESGLGMLLLDSKIEGWVRVRGRIEQTAHDEDCESFLAILTKEVRPIVYPACVQSGDPSEISGFNVMDEDK